MIITLFLFFFRKLAVFLLIVPELENLLRVRLVIVLHIRQRTVVIALFSTTRLAPLALRPL